MTPRNATAAVVGAGDYIGAAIAKRFAAEGFIVHAGRRNGDKLAPLVHDIEAAGGRVAARSLDARKEDDIAAFLSEAEAVAPLEVCVPRLSFSDLFRMAGIFPASQAPDAPPVQRLLSRRAPPRAEDRAARPEIRTASGLHGFAGGCE